jgi:hypothetical protein
MRDMEDKPVRIEWCPRIKFTVHCLLRGELETWDANEFVHLIQDCACVNCKLLMTQAQQFYTHKFN